MLFRSDHRQSVQATKYANATAPMAAVASSMPCRPPRARSSSTRTFDASGATASGARGIRFDERADDRQRDALVNILSGEETNEMATVWWVFSATSPNKHPLLFKPINLQATGNYAILEPTNMAHRREAKPPDVTRVLA